MVVASTWPVAAVHLPLTTSARRSPEAAPGITMMVAGRPWYSARSTSSGRWPPVTCGTQAGTGGAEAAGWWAEEEPVAALALAPCWVSTALTWASS